MASINSSTAKAPPAMTVKGGVSLRLGLWFIYCMADVAVVKLYIQYSNMVPEKKIAAVQNYINSDKKHTLIFFPPIAQLGGASFIPGNSVCLPPGKQSEGDLAACYCFFVESKAALAPDSYVERLAIRADQHGLAVGRGNA